MNTLLIASESALMRFDIPNGKSETLCPLEADNRATRSNDGRADPWGGFWIGTMGKGCELGAGAILLLPLRTIQCETKKARKSAQSRPPVGNSCASR